MRKKNFETEICLALTANARAPFWPDFYHLAFIADVIKRTIICWPSVQKIWNLMFKSKLKLLTAEEFTHDVSQFSDNLWHPLPPSSRVLVPRILYCCHKILDTPSPEGCDVIYELPSNKFKLTFRVKRHFIALDSGIWYSSSYSSQKIWKFLAGYN
jgi:hypothetical protein